MPESEPTPQVPPGGNNSAAALLSVVDAYLEDLRQGKAPDRAAVLAAHPELAPQLESCLAALDFIHRAERTDPAVPPTLGDFRIVREIGRGAMGVVYEAEQVSLKRQVALKVLRFGASPDQEAMARFRREAETVAALHHTNIAPLFAVGSEAGVHFFAMQLIAGRSLAAVLDEANAAGVALDAKKVVGWGVQAAEALAHAHARGVVHRDVKPSNLLLDGEGTVWLTDFGLARRRDEATLTTAGVQLGTPRYMSPEQAAAARAPVDQRSDVYSLGATLYELATGKPVFEAPTAGQLFEQIATAEPVPPRRHRPALPRDLETVLLRCLAKDPAQRYPTARDLADDLRRVAAGDPVKARRPSLLRRLRRWAGRRRAQAPLVAGAAAIAVVVTVVLGLAGLFGWHFYHEARKGSVTLLVEGGLGRGEIRGKDGKLAVPPFTLPTQAPIELPGGWYSLRVIQSDRLSEDYELFIEQGQHRTFTVGCNDRELWEPMPIKGTVAGDFGLLHIAPEPGPKKDPWGEPLPAAVIIKRLGMPAQKSGKWETKEFEEWRKTPFTPAKLWELKLKRQDDPILAKLKDDEWTWFCVALLSLGQDNIVKEKRPPGCTLLQPAPDLDGDKVGDLVFALGHYLLAISGKDGKLLWCQELHSNVFRTKTETWSLLTEADELSLVPLSLAQAIPGVTVPVPPSIYTETKTMLAGPPFVVADINGDGHPDLILAHGAFWCRLPGYSPAVVRPCVEALSGRTGETLWPHQPASLAERLVVDKHKDAQRVKEQVGNGDFSSLGKLKPLTGFASFTELRIDKKRILVAGLFPGLERLNLLTGKTVAPPDPPLDDFLRLYGSGEPKGRRVEAWSADGKIALVTDSGEGLHAIDSFSGKSMWGKSSRVGGESFVDLNGDGVPEIISKFGVADGATGTDVWEAKKLFKDAPDALLVAPDFDGDGWRDIFVATICDGERFGHPPGVKVLVAGLRSGQDGRPLWLSAEPIPGSGNFSAGAVFYWQAAPGAAGYFVVNVYRFLVGQKADLHTALIFAADTGRLAHIWPGVTVEGVADLDGDGFLDLYGRRGDQLVTVRGTAPELWRRPGLWSWQVSFGPGYLTGPVPHADLDGDGVADVLLYTPSSEETHLSLQAYSGRDGRQLWSLSLGGRQSWSLSDAEKSIYDHLHNSEAVECLDLEDNKQPIVVIWGPIHGGLTGSCALLDGRTGNLLLSKEFSGEPRPDLLYRQPDGRLALVYVEFPEGGHEDGVLVAFNAAGQEVARTPFPKGDGDDGLPVPKGFEFRPLYSFRLQKKFHPYWLVREDKVPWRFGFEWGDWDRLSDYPDEPSKKMLFAVGWRDDPADSALLRLYRLSDNGLNRQDRLTVLRKGIPKDPATEVPTHSYPDEVVLLRPLPWLERARTDVVWGVVSVVVYLGLVAVYAAMGRRRTALLLLALFILLPASSAFSGLFLVLVLLAEGKSDTAAAWRVKALVLLILTGIVLVPVLAMLLPQFVIVFGFLFLLVLLNMVALTLPRKAIPRGQDRPRESAGVSRGGLVLLFLQGTVLTSLVLAAPSQIWKMEDRSWTYLAVLAPLVGLALVGRMKAALGLLIPCLLLLVYLNWPPRGNDWPLWGIGESSYSQWIPSNLSYSENALLPCEAWDWSGWYWLWPLALDSWRRRCMTGDFLAMMIPLGTLGGAVYGMVVLYCKRLEKEGAL
jgi:hypothetical protein